LSKPKPKLKRASRSSKKSCNNDLSCTCSVLECSEHADPPHWGSAFSFKTILSISRESVVE